MLVVLQYYFTSYVALQKLNTTGKGTACIPELHTEVEKVFTIHTK